MYEIGDIVSYHGIKSQITAISDRDNGFNIVYLEGNKKGWMDWVARPIFLDEYEGDDEQERQSES